MAHDDQPTGSVQVTSRSLHSYREMFCLTGREIAEVARRGLTATSVPWRN